MRLDHDHKAAAKRVQSKRTTNVGATDAIRNALKLGECDKHELQRRTGLPMHTVVSVVGGLCVNGGAIPLGTRQSRTYASAPEASRKEKAAPAENATAGRRVKISDRPLNRDPFSHMRLCEMTRR